MDPITGEKVAVGATCDLSTCHCVCDSTYCLESPADVGGYTAGTDDMTCVYKCDCQAACNTTSAFLEAWTSQKDPTALDRCVEPCTVCTGDPTLCAADEDCIVNTGPSATGSTCVESGFCTASKNAMCDDAYAAVSGKKNKRAKCCPDTR